MKIAIYCGSSAGNDAGYVEQTRKLGHYLAEQQIDVVYGGGKVGLMGTIADAVLEKGGRVYGVIPEYLESKEIAHPHLTELSIVPDMHARKARMAAMADAFVALPGGPGTLEEIFEAWTWGQLGHHAKPCAFYNIDSYYTPLLEGMIPQMVKAGFLGSTYAGMLVQEDQPEALVTALKGYQPPRHKWS
ncbi:LOG family protein [Endozoicomonadaceae bacterium StTr2]